VHYRYNSIWKFELRGTEDAGLGGSVSSVYTVDEQYPLRLLEAPTRANVGSFEAYIVRIRESIEGNSEAYLVGCHRFPLIELRLLIK
jgi:hypothetical protein